MIFKSIGSKFQLKLKDRKNAGNILGEALKDIIKNDQERMESTVVLGIPRGGVVVADIVAKKLSCMFDIVIPRKLGAPHNEEVAIGAIMEDSTIYLNEEIVGALQVPEEYIEKAKLRQRQEIKRRTMLYRHSREYELSNIKNIVLVDDGAATGATVIVAARWVRKSGHDNNSNNNEIKQRLIVAVPVIPRDTLELIKKEGQVDHIETVTTPSNSNFKSVGQYYQSFEAVSDEQVIQIMKNHNLL